MKKTISKQRNGGAVSPFSQPFASFPMRSMLDDWFGEMFENGGQMVSGGMKTAMDVAETDQAYEVSLDLPGVKPEEVEIQIDRNTLTVRGKRESQEEEKDESKQYHRIERYSGSFSRSVVLPNAVSEDGAVAEFRDGVLNITIPKSEDARPRKIAIKTKK